jgi:release factor glutamine methyltransferase
MAQKRIAKLPSLDHLTLEDYDCVYEPSDDTFLLCDALENDREMMSEIQPGVVLEVGCGSGCVITFLSMLLLEQGIPALSLATDINPKAAAVTLRTAKANNVWSLTSTWPYVCRLSLINLLFIGAS